MVTIYTRGIRRPFWGQKSEKVYGTRSSQAVTHPSTILARRCLTSVIRRERVYSSWYGRRLLGLSIAAICLIEKLSCRETEFLKNQLTFEHQKTGPHRLKDGIGTIYSIVTFVLFLNVWL